MGDLVRDALRASGIDEEVERVIADALVQSWSENRPTNLPATERKLRTSSTEPNLAKVRIVAEQLWRRLERIYDAKLQAWKQNEEKTMEEMIARLRHEYKENLSIKQKQLEELTERKDDEYRNKEDLLREDVRLTFEKKKLECEKAWREIETAQNEIRFRKELLDNARANFQTKKDNELYRIEQERRSLEQAKEFLKTHERTLDARMQEGIKKAHKKDKAEMALMVSEWNKKEAMLSKKYSLVWDKIREISDGQHYSAQEVERAKKLEEEITHHQRKLAGTEQALRDALENQLKTNENMEDMKKEKEELSKENQKLKEKLERRESTVNVLKKRLKMVEESAAVRINELKLHHKLATDKLEAIGSELRKYRSKELEKFSQFRNRSPTSEFRPQSTSYPAHYPVHPSTMTMLDSDSQSSSTPTESSSFEQHFRERMKTLDAAKQHLDFSLEKLRLRGCSEPADYIQTVQLPHTDTADHLEKPVRSLPADRGLKRRPSTTEISAAQSTVVKAAPIASPKSTAADRGEDVVQKSKEREITEQSEPNNIEKKDTEVEITDKPSENSAIDPMMLRYMKMVQEQRKKEKATTEQKPAEKNIEPPEEESFEIEAAERPVTPDTPSDFGW